MTSLFGAVAQMAPNYVKIDYQWNAGDTGTCFKRRVADGQWSDRANLGCQSGSDTTYYGSNAEGHSEQHILKAATGVGFSDKSAGAFADAIKEGNDGEKIDLNLYTEMRPCYGGLNGYNCQNLLGNVLSDASTITYSSQSRVEKGQQLAAAGLTYLAAQKGSSKDEEKGDKDDKGGGGSGGSGGGGGKSEDMWGGITDEELINWAEQQGY